MEQITFNFPFQKVNREKRIVTGIATADNVDQSGEQVDFDGSLEAFQKWVGNIREMHGKEAVGKSVGYRPTTVQADDGNIYRGIEVDVYISKGAPNTWEKILDGTLRGFSIGGAVISKRDVFNKSLGQNVTLIEKYFLGELSVVDNPDNPIANFSIVKRAKDGELEMSLEKTFDIYYCAEHGVAKAESVECTHCDTDMVHIGSVEEFDTEVINKMMDDFNLQKVKNSHKSPPKGYPTDRGQYADPKNFKYPLDSESRIHAAEAYYNHDGQQSAGGYSDSEWSSIGSKIVSALNGLGSGKYSLEGGKIVSKDISKAAATAPETCASCGEDAGDLNSDSICKACAVQKDAGDDGDDMDKAVDAEDNLDNGKDEASEDANGKKIKKSLQNKTSDGSVSDMDLSTDQKVGMIAKFMTWLGFEQNDVDDVVEKSVDVADVVTEPVVDEKDNGGSEVDINEIAALLDDKLGKLRTEISEEIDGKVDTIAKSVGEVSEKVDSTIEKVNTIDEGTAIKKSVDVADDDTENDDKIEKSAKGESFWGGKFVPSEIVSALGYES